MPKQNRPLVRDGRLQAKKKRTDRTYLRPAGATAPAPAPVEEEQAPAEEPQDGAALLADTLAPESEPAPVTAAAAAMTPTPASTRVPASVRAIQQQGVRKRRELDVHALAERDTRYALHELRRILILAALVVVALVVLAIVLR